MLNLLYIMSHSFCPINMKEILVYTRPDSPQKNFSFEVASGQFLSKHPVLYPVLDYWRLIAFTLLTKIDYQPFAYYFILILN